MLSMLFSYFDLVVYKLFTTSACAFINNFPLLGKLCKMGKIFP